MENPKYVYITLRKPKVGIARANRHNTINVVVFPGGHKELGPGCETGLHVPNSHMEAKSARANPEQPVPSNGS